jgi:hypothetical protein
MSINKHLISEIVLEVFNDFHTDTVCTSGYIASNDKIINERWIGRDVEGSGRLFWATTPEWENHGYLHNEFGTERPRKRSLYSGYVTDWESEKAWFDSQ